jgi:2-polyprenyl-3-methyl-5-hydroxy-6-metoxy-1,4-benzoquinol methylase
LEEHFVQDAWLESYLPWRSSKSLEMWQAAGVDAGRPGGLRVLDVACGCAAKSLALARASLGVRVTCPDSAEVLEVARDLAERLGVQSQVVFRSANLLDTDLGEGQFDAALCGQITHYLTAEQNVGLFRRIYSALSPNGVLVIDCPMASDEPTETASLLTLMLWANSGGAAHSFETYRGWLSGSGFRQINQFSDRWIAAVK